MRPTLFTAALFMFALAACGRGSDDVVVDSDSEDTDVDTDVIDSDTDVIDTGCELATWYPDQDGDGYGSTVDAREACEAPDDGLTWLTTAGDCNDNAAAINPDGTEICDDADVDEDCDGDIDDDDASTDPASKIAWYSDDDRDGYGDMRDTRPAMGCMWPSDSRVDNNEDCDDGDDARHPGAEDPDFDGIDQDCDGS